MERAEAEAIYDAGREACVDFILELAKRSQELAAHGEKLARRCERLEARVERLEEELRKSSRNSSKPPSSDPPKTGQERRAEARAKAKELLRGEREQRKAGGQPGHRGSGRKLAPEDQVDEIVDHFPTSCRHCGHGFGSAELRPCSRFGRHQVAELPPIAVRLTEHRTHRLCCPQCKAATTAALPDELKGSAFGPRAQAAVPTNNAAERALRGPVIHRKLSHGTRSEDGERFIERALSASVTCRLQGRSLFAYLAELLTARSRGQPLPALA
jgi:hypothetical protein